MGNLWNDPVAAQAFTRFGLGGRPDDEVPADPKQWLLNQITCPDQAPVQGMPTVASGLTLLWQRGQAAPGSPQEQEISAEISAALNADIQAYHLYAVTTPIPFRERLVRFWQNHFAVMTATVPMSCVAGPYVRDAIRPNMTGTIAQMLTGIIRHPAMLFSLNAQKSIGPQSKLATQMAKRGLVAFINENLGRETLELYTVGASEGYG
jgi:uncharacterized protein (DUF1800 family)